MSAATSLRSISTAGAAAGCALAVLAAAPPARAAPAGHAIDVTAALDDDAPANPTDLPTRARLVTSIETGGGIEGLGWQPDGGAVLVAREHAIEWRDPSTLRVVRTVPLAPGERANAILPQGVVTIRAARGEATVLGLRRFATPTVVAPWLAAIVAQVHADAVDLGPSFSDDGARVMFQGHGEWFGGADAGGDVAAVYDVGSGRTLGVAPFETAGPIASAALTSSGRFVAWSSRVSGAFVDVARPVEGPDYGAHAVLSPDDRFVIADVPQDRWLLEPGSSSPGLIRAGNGRRVYALPRRESSATSVFCPSGVGFAAIRDGHVGLYRVDRSAAFSELTLAGATSVSFAPGGDRVVVASSDGRLHLVALDACVTGGRSPVCRVSRACATSRRRPAVLRSGG